VDRWKGEPFLSDTDKSSRNVLSFFIEPPEGVEFIKITARPSGTEPKRKIYVEVGGKPAGEDEQTFQNEKKRHDALGKRIMDGFTKIAYDCVGINMPERGFRLSPLLPVEVKLKYFDVEEELLKLENQLRANEITGGGVKKRVDELLTIFGQDPIEKISGAFREKTGMSLRNFFNQKFDKIRKEC
jgi:phosphoglucomutase/phosphomannomutase